MGQVSDIGEGGDLVETGREVVEVGYQFTRWW